MNHPQPRPAEPLSAPASSPHLILAVNPGSTSTKISLYENERELFTEEINHPPAELARYDRISDQYPFRKAAVQEILARRGVLMESLSAVVGRGGMLRPVRSGVFAVTGPMLDDLRAGLQGDHASNLGGLIAHDLAREADLPAFILDPPVVDEVDPVARITGFKEIRRNVIFHALSQIATAKRYAEETGRPYQSLNLIVAHLGGGISVGAHFKGRVVDVNDALTGEGPFSPERSGSLPVGQLIDLCFSGKYTKEELKRKNKGQGGLLSLLGTSDFREVEKRVAAGDAQARVAAEAMAYQIAKAICALTPAFNGERPDQVLVTGGLAQSPLLTGRLRERLAGFGAAITLYPGQNEMRALVLGALRALTGKETVHVYDV